MAPQDGHAHAILLSVAAALTVLACIRKRRRLSASWDRALAKRAPILSAGDGSWRTRKYFGQLSSYGADHDPPMSPKAFYDHFRFERRHIQQLVVALRLPPYFHLVSGGVVEGDEALLIYLKRMAYPNRLADLEPMFGRSPTWLSRVVDAVRQHLDPIASAKLDQLDFLFLDRWMRTFTSAIHAKGAPFTNMFGFIDGTFRPCCRPGVDGYRGAAQAAVWDGYHRSHGSNYQAIVSANWIMLQMQGPWFTNDIQMLNESGLIRRRPAPLR